MIPLAFTLHTTDAFEKICEFPLRFFDPFSGYVRSVIELKWKLQTKFQLFDLSLDITIYVSPTQNYVWSPEVNLGTRLDAAGVYVSPTRNCAWSPEVNLGTRLDTAGVYVSPTQNYVWSPEVNLGTRLDAAGVYVSPTQNYAWSPEINIGTRRDSAEIYLSSTDHYSGITARGVLGDYHTIFDVVSYNHVNGILSDASVALDLFASPHEQYLLSSRTNVFTTARPPSLGPAIDYYSTILSRPNTASNAVI